MSGVEYQMVVSHGDLLHRDEEDTPKERILVQNLNSKIPDNPFRKISIDIR